MVVVFMASLMLSAIAFSILNHSKASIWVVGMHIGCLINMFGYFMIFAKIGGLPSTIEKLFFINDNLHNKFSYVVISFDNITRMLVAGRVIFIACLLIVTLFTNRDSEKRIRRFYSVFGLSVLLENIVMFDPWLTSCVWDYSFIKLNSEFICTGSRILLIAFVLLTIQLFFYNYRQMVVTWIKRMFGYTILMIVGLGCQFIIFGVFGPLHLSDATGFNYLLGTLLYYTPNLSVFYWFLLVFFSVTFLAVGTYSLWRYYKVENEITQPDVSVEKKIHANDAGAKMFTHGIKNQLLAQRILIKSLSHKVDEDSIEEAKQILQELEGVNEKIMQRMDELYRVFKSNAMVLKPENIKAIMELSVSKLSKKNEHVHIVINRFADGIILADRSRLSEVFCNILSNSFDAIVAKEPMVDGNITIDCTYERSSYIVAITDTGIGIQPDKMKKIFEPFYTEKNTSKNWGLGLSYAQKVIKYHYGDIRINSQVGVGTTFYVILPAFTKK